MSRAGVGQAGLGSAYGWFWLGLGWVSGSGSPTPGWLVLLVGWLGLVGLTLAQPGAHERVVFKSTI